MSLKLLFDSQQESSIDNQQYRARLMRIFNFLRVGVIFLIVITILNKGIFEDSWRDENSKFSFLLIASLYLCSLIFHYWVTTQLKEYKYFIITNSVFDLLLVTILGLYLIHSKDWVVLALISFISGLLTVLVITFKEGIFYGIFLATVLVISFLISLYLDNSYINNWSSFFILVSKHFSTVIQVLFISLGEGFLVILISLLASQARDNKITAKINSANADRLRRLNASILENISSGLIVSDINGNLITLNKRARSIFNVDSYEKIPDRVILFSTALAKRLGKWQEMKVHNTSPLEIFGQGYSVTFNNLIEEDGCLVLIQLESVIENMNKVRENRLGSLGRLTAAIAHEIKNPLSSIQGASQLLSENNELLKNPDINFLIEKIYRNSERIGSIITNILDVFNNKPRQNEVVLLNTFIRQVVDDARINDELKNVYIKCELSESENYHVYFDPSHLRQVLDNLMLNSVKHGGKKDINIQIMTSKGLGERSLYIDVIDNGKGVRMSDEERIFEPFFSSMNSPGLGLYLVREICVANQAQITYVRKQNSGACFRIIMECFKGN